MVVPYYTFVGKIAGIKVIGRSMSRTEWRNQIINPNRMLKAVDTARTALRKIGVPAKNIRSKKLRNPLRSGAPIHEQEIDVIPSVSAAQSVYKTLAKEKTAIVASLGTSYATALAIAKKPTKKPAKKTTKKKSVSKYKLTPKQKAALKKNGYVFITRNKKQIRITR